MSDKPECMVIGAGVAGVSAAIFLARRGIQTMVVERRIPSNPTHQTMQVVELEVFSDLGISLPEQAIYSRPKRYISATSDGNTRIDVEEPPIACVKLDELLISMRQEAERHGVEFLYETEGQVGPFRDGKREVLVGGKRMEAPVVIDASGFNYARLPNAINPGFDVFDAWQGLYQIDAPQTARTWMHEQNLAPEHFLSFSHVAGSASFLSVMVSEDVQEISVRAFVLDREGFRTAREVVDEFILANPWIGQSLASDGGKIPLRHFSESFVDDGVIRVGNVAGMTLPSLGQGIAVSMRAAQLAGNTAAASIQRGRTDRSELWIFNTTYQQKLGLLGTTYQPTRHFSMSSNSDEYKALIKSGLVDADDLRKLLSGEMVGMTLPHVRPLLTQMAELLPIIPRFARAIELSVRFHRHYTSYPSRPRDFARWNQKTEDLFQLARRIATSGMKG